MKLGVLALQGDFYLHVQMLRKLEVETVCVKKPADLETCQGLILPGGESTTFLKLLKNSGLMKVLPDYAREHCLFGTCAGLIILAKKISNIPQHTFNLIDITVERNAYGRQIDSFIAPVELVLNHERAPMEGVFIRAPRIVEVGQGVRVLGYHKDEIVMAENDRVLVATFHPELTEDDRVHRYFLDKIKATGN